MPRLPRPLAGIVRVGCVVVFSACLVGAACANSLPTVPAPGGGECTAMANILDTPGLWLGHFTGGRFVRADAVRMVDWRDQYSCFPSGAACRDWQRHLLHAYRQIQGYRTCLPLR